jgi:hypothetical protein
MDMRWGLSKKEFRWTFRFLGLSRKEVSRLWSMPEADAKRYMNEWLRAGYPSQEARRLCDVPYTKADPLTDEGLSRVVEKAYAEAIARRSFEGWWATFWIGAFVLLIVEGLPWHWHWPLSTFDAVFWIVAVLTFHLFRKAEYLYAQVRQLAKCLDELGADTEGFVERFRQVW